MIYDEHSVEFMFFLLIVITSFLNLMYNLMGDSTYEWNSEKLSGNSSSTCQISFSNFIILTNQMM